MGDAQPAVQPVSERRREIDLNDDGHGEQRDDQRLRQDLPALEREEQHDRREQRGNRPGLEPGERTSEPGFSAAQEKRSPRLGEQDRSEDVECDGREKGVPRHRDRGQPEQDADDRREREDHDRVVQCDLA